MGRVDESHIPSSGKPTTIGEPAWQTFTRHKRQNKRRLGAKQLKTLRPIALQLLSCPRFSLSLSLSLPSLPFRYPPPPPSLSLFLSLLRLSPYTSYTAGRTHPSRSRIHPFHRDTQRKHMDVCSSAPIQTHTHIEHTYTNIDV